MNIEDGNINSFIKKTFHNFPIRKQKKLNIDFLKEFNLNANECFYLLDLFQNKIIYKRGFINLLGFKDDAITIDFLFKNFHPDDSEIVHRVTKAAISYCKEHPGNSDSSQLFLTYRHRTKEGLYIKVLNQITIFDTNNDDIIKTLLIRLTDISFLDNSDNVSWTFKKINLNEKVFKGLVYDSYKNFFSKRELEVIDKIAKKLSNKEIGQQLHISEDTVASHRKNIFKKAKCHNPEELIIFCKGKGIL